MRLREYARWYLGHRSLELEGDVLEVFIEDQLEKMERSGAKLITLDDDDYPPLLKEIPNPPFGFFCIGDCSTLKGEFLSIVGTRRSSRYGEEVARKFARELSKYFVVVSGMAYGIDSKAHEGAIEAGGKTIAVLASGVDLPSPKGNIQLYRKILKSGCVISPYPLGEGARKHRFVERNTLIAGISIGTLVVEAPMKSGALITASLAADYGRDVFAVPSDIVRKSGEGTNYLIKVGAIPVTSPADIISHYGIGESPGEEESNPVLELVRDGVGDPGEIAEMLGMDLSVVMAKLSELELEGKVFQDGGIYRAI